MLRTIDMAATIEKVKARLPPAVDHRRGDPAGWIGWIVIPSWLLSLALHTALLCVMAFVLHRPSGFGTSGFGDGETGIYAGLGNGTAPGLPGDGTGLPIGETVGIFDGPAQGAAGAREAGTSESASNSALKAPQRPRALDDGDADDAPPVALDLPAAPKVARLGFGSAAPAGSAGDARDMIKSSGRTNSAGRGGSADGSGDGGGGEGPGGGG
ncbi:MAG TPA: hypothetical protein VKU82_12010, partial [Planctomycetaceae bacterium]|nr:hypothetical protein [Planctomycetaceae bacterium]